MNTEKRESFSTFADIHLEAIDPVKQVHTTKHRFGPFQHNQIMNRLSSHTHDTPTISLLCLK